MKKFYIPTSTLNFNNILSSESISPKAFYDKRRFGYSRWATVEENPFNNAIVLYDNLCYFERPKSDIEDHPLLIEILLDETKLKQAEGFWYCDHTIYLAPTTTRFLFYTESDKTITLSMSESSLETKLLRLYSRQILTIQKPTELFKPISMGEPCGLNEHEIEKDARTNKMKGILYGYYIGSMLSTDSDSVKHLNVLKEIHNIFAAILSSFEKRPTAYQDERLDALFDYLNEQNADFKSLYEIISSSIDNKSKTKRVWSWIFGKRGYVKYEDKSVWLPYLQYATENDNKENQAITWIKSNIEEAKRQMYAKRHLLSPDEGEIVVIDNSVSSLKNPNIASEVESRLCVSWLNETLSEKNTNGKISTYKEELAKNLTLKAKEIYQDSWESCQTRAYLNDLRRHIAGAEFNYEWNNGLLSSIAAVLIAGDDWEKLLSFMQNKKMTDYKLAFAFYGALNGFANLTIDFTDLLYSQDKNYVREVYKEFYGQLQGEPLTEIAENHIFQKDSLHQLGQTNTNHPAVIVPKGNTSDESYILVRMIQSYQKYNAKKHEHYCAEIIKGDLTNWDVIRKLSSKNDGWKTLIDDLKKSAKTNKTTDKKDQTTLFDAQEMYPTGEFFYCDKNAWYHIEQIVSGNNAKNSIKEDLDWFQNDISLPNDQRKYYKGLDESNNRLVIEKFYNLKRNAPYYTEEIRKRIREKLISLYCP